MTPNSVECGGSSAVFRYQTSTSLCPVALHQLGSLTLQHWLSSSFSDWGWGEGWFVHLRCRETQRKFPLSPSEMPTMARAGPGRMQEPSSWSYSCFQGEKLQWEARAVCPNDSPLCLSPFPDGLTLACFCCFA